MLAELHLTYLPELMGTEVWLRVQGHSVGVDRHSVGVDRHSVGVDRHSVGVDKAFGYRGVQITPTEGGTYLYRDCKSPSSGQNYWETDKQGVVCLPRVKS